MVNRWTYKKQSLTMADCIDFRQNIHDHAIIIMRINSQQYNMISYDTHSRPEQRFKTCQAILKRKNACWHGRSEYGNLFVWGTVAKPSSWLNHQMVWSVIFIFWKCVGWVAMGGLWTILMGSIYSISMYTSNVHAYIYKHDVCVRERTHVIMYIYIY